MVLNQGSLPYQVNPSAPEARRQIVETWKRFGYKATLVDESGKRAELFDLYLDFYPPGGRGSLLESVPPMTKLPLLVDGGGADEIEFSKIARIEVEGSQLRVTLRSGQTEAGNSAELDIASAVADLIEELVKLPVEKLEDIFQKR